MVWNTLSEAIGRSRSDALRATLDRFLSGLGLGPCPLDRRATNSVAFTIAVVALAAKVAKADGVVTKAETNAFRRIFKSTAADDPSVQRVFDLAKQDTAGIESYARQIAELLADNPQLRRDVFEALFHIAASDGVLHRDEEVHLRTIAEIFGLTDRQYRSVRAAFVHDPDDAYTVLGVRPDATDTELRQRYRELVRRNHPDALSARGVPAEFIEMATRKMAAINEAYDLIAKERRI